MARDGRPGVRSIDEAVQFAAGDWRRGYFKGGRLAETVARAGALAETLAEHASSLAEGALRFCLSEDAVSTVIPGMRSPAHVGQNCAVSDGRLLLSEVLKKLRDHSTWPRNFYADAW